MKKYKYFFLALWPVGLKNWNEVFEDLIVSEVYLLSCSHQPKHSVEDQYTLLQK